MPNLMICGYARHGKDTFAEMLAKYANMTFESSSHFAARQVVYPVLKDKYDYETLEQCYEDRVNHREEWFDLIRAYNEDDLCRLSREIFKVHDMYVGIRNPAEFFAARDAGIFDLSIWVEASQRHPPEPNTSNGMQRSMCDLVVENNHPIDQLDLKAQRLAGVINARFDR